MLATLALAGAGTVRLPARAQSADVWSPTDGLRVAGPISGLEPFDPALARDVQQLPVLRQVFRGLTSFTPEMGTTPDLAAEITPSSDATRYEIVLREDIAFHDGRAITSGDVLASFVRALSPSIASGDRSALVAATYLGGIVGAQEVLDGTATTLRGFVQTSDRAFTIELIVPDAAFPQKLASVAASVVDAQTWGTTVFPNGSGPYRVTAYDAASTLDLMRSDGWWGETPAIERVTIRLGNAATQPVNLFQAGDIDLVDGMTADAMRLLTDPASGAAIGEVIETPLFSLTYLALGTQTAPLDDVHVRRAIQRMFPVATFAAAGSGNVVAAEGVIPPGMLGETWAAMLPPIDIDAARAELAQSRYGDASSVPPITVFTGQMSPADPLHNVGVALQELVGEPLGLTIEPVGVEWGDFLSGLPQGRFPTYGITWVADYPDPEAMLGVLFGSDSSENYSGYANPEFDALLAAAQTAGEEQERIAAFRQAQQVLIDDAAVIPLYFDIGYTALRPGVTGVPVSPIGILGFEAIRGAS